MVDDPDLAARLASGSSAALSGQSPHDASMGTLAVRRPVLETLTGTVCPAGQVTVPASRSIAKSRLPSRPLDLALGHRCEHLDPALGELSADGPVAVGGVAEDPRRARCSGGWLIDQVLGLRAVVSPPGATSTAMISGSLLLVAAAESL